MSGSVERNLIADWMVRSVIKSSHGNLLSGPKMQIAVVLWQKSG